MQQQIISFSTPLSALSAAALKLLLDSHLIFTPSIHEQQLRLLLLVLPTRSATQAQRW